MLTNADDGPPAENQATRHLQYPVMIVLVLLVVLSSLRFAPPFCPVSRDSGVFLYGGQSLIDGGLPYRDFWDHKPPLVFLIDAVGLKLGQGRRGVWILETTVFAGACWVFLALLWQALGPWPATAAAAFVAFAGRNPRLFEGGNLTEGYALCLVMVILGIAARGPRRLGWWITAGFFGSAVFFTKESCIAVPVGLGITLGVMAVVRPSPQHRKALLAYVTGGAIAAGAVLALLLGSGILREFWLSNVVFSKLYMEGQPSGMSITAFQNLIRKTHQLGLLAPAAVAWAAAVLSLIRRPPKSAENGENLLAASIVFAIPAELVFIGLPGRGYGHYFLTLIATVGAGTGIVMAMLTSALRRAWSSAPTVKRNALLTAIAAVLSFAPVSSRGGLRAAASWVAHTSRAVANDPSVANYLASRPSNEHLLILGMETRWNFLSNRRAPTRYTYITPLLYPQFDQKLRLDEFLGALQDHPDTLIIDAFGLVDSSASPAFTRSRNSAYFGRLRDRFPPEWLAAFRTFVRRGWRLDRELPGGWVTYIPHRSVADPDQNNHSPPQDDPKQ